MPSAAPRDDLVIGVDIGGTKVAAGLVDLGGKVLFHTRNPMVCSDGPVRALAAVTQAIETVSAQATSIAEDRKLIRGIGICSPGPLDPNTGSKIAFPHAGFPKGSTR
jgi:glucokinase